MSKLKSLFAILGWFWNHSGSLMRLINAVQDKLPLIITALRWSADSLDRLTSLETQIVTTINDAEIPLTQIPLPGFSSQGFYDALTNALSRLHVPIITPNDDIRNELNQIRLPTVACLNTSPRNSTLASTWHERARQLITKVNKPDNPVENSAQALRNIADLLEVSQS